MDKKTEEALQNGIKDTMWSMFWRGKQRANLPELEESVKRLIRMATQKNAGQRKDSTCIDWKSLDMELLRIAVEATAFVLDSRFEMLIREWERMPGIVLCEDCIHYDTEDNWCYKHGFNPQDGDYCSYGEEE